MFVQLVCRWSPGRAENTHAHTHARSCGQISYWTRRNQGRDASQREISRIRSAPEVWCWSAKDSRWSKYRYLRWSERWMSRESTRRREQFIYLWRVVLFREDFWSGLIRCLRRSTTSGAPGNLQEEDRARACQQSHNTKPAKQTTVAAGTCSCIY